MKESKEEVVKRIYGLSIPQLQGVMKWFAGKGVEEQDKLEYEYYCELSKEEILKYCSFQEWLFKNKLFGGGKEE